MQFFSGFSCQPSKFNKSAVQFNKPVTDSTSVPKLLNWYIIQTWFCVLFDL